MWILFFKSVHIVGFVAWFAGLFYLVRMFVYHVEARKEEEPKRSILEEQFHKMQLRVYRIIVNPGMMLTWTCGIAMLALNPAYLQQGWLHIKLTLLVLLTIYHLYCKRIIAKLENGQNPMTSFQFRLFNEVPTLFLVLIALLAVYRNSLNLGYAFLGLIGFGLLNYIGAKIYRRRRETGKAI